MTKSEGNTNDEIQMYAPASLSRSSGIHPSFITRHSSFAGHSHSRLQMNDTPKIQAVAFDVGGTLLQPWPSVGGVYAEVAAKHGEKNLSPEKLNKKFAMAWRSRKNFQHTHEDWSRLVDQTFAGLCESRPSRTFFPAIYQRFAELGAWRMYEDVLPALDALASKDIPLAVISNWDARLRPLLQQFHLD